MKRTFRMLCVAMATIVMMSMCACSFLPGSSTPTVTMPPDSSVTVTTMPQEESTEGINMITGRPDMAGATATRPVGIMVANNDFIQDEQVGLSTADMWVESETEGGITRIMAVFASTGRVPASIGPVRSARSPFFSVVQALDIAYCHAGGSYTALNKIASSSIADLDVNTGSGSAYAWRDSSYPHEYEYTLRTSAEGLTKYMTDKGYNQQAQRDFPWTHGEVSGAATANSISVKMSGAQTIGFEYDSATGEYYKNNGASRNRHCDIDGVPLTAANVLVLYTDKFWENDTTIDFYLQNGKGYVFSNGTERRFDWSRGADGFVMTEEDGTQLTLATGKVYMCVVASEYESAMSFS